MIYYVQLLLIFITLAVYFMFGTTWYFWVLFSLSIILVCALDFGFFMLKKSIKTREEE